MKELDELLAGFFERSFDSLSRRGQLAFDRLLSLQDPEILDLLAGRAAVDDQDLNEIIMRILNRS
jgi:antitoxin CptB